VRKLRILIADDHGLVRRGARALLQARRGWKVVGEAGNGRAARKGKGTETGCGHSRYQHARTSSMPRRSKND
jgi:hypothetical protein